MSAVAGVPAAGAGAGPSALCRALAVYVVTDRASQRGRTELEVAEACIAGGATAVQLRAKDRTAREACALASALADRCRARGVLFIVNDRLDIALACNAGGVHLGPDDLPPAAARRLAPPGFVIGVSAGDPDEAAAARADGADYLGVGSVFATRTKPDAGAPIGPEGLARVVAATRLPVVAIGGIGPANAAAAVGAGACGVAVVSAVVGADDVAKATAELAAVVAGALSPRWQGRRG